MPAHTAGCSQGFPSQAHCINPSLKQLQQHQGALTTSGQGTAKPPRATSRGKRDLLVFPPSTTILSPFPSSFLSRLQPPILLLHAHSLYFDTQDCAFSFILCHCYSTPVSLFQVLHLCGFFFPFPVFSMDFFLYMRGWAKGLFPFIKY